MDKETEQDGSQSLLVDGQDRSEEESAEDAIAISPTPRSGIISTTTITTTTTTITTTTTTIHPIPTRAGPAPALANADLKSPVRGGPAVGAPPQTRNGAVAPAPIPPIAFGIPLDPPPAPVTDLFPLREVRKQISCCGWVWIGAVVALWLVVIALDAITGIFLLLLMIPPLLLLKYWRRHSRERALPYPVSGARQAVPGNILDELEPTLADTSQAVPLDVLVRLFGLAFYPGALCVMIIEALVTLLAAVICLSDQLDDIGKQLSGGDQNNDGGKPTPPSPDPVLGAVTVEHTIGYYIFIFLVAYLVAAFTEELLKYILIGRVRKYVPDFFHWRGYLMCALAAALGFSTVENFGYVFSGAAGARSALQGSEALGMRILVVMFLTFERMCVSTPVHVMCALFTALGYIQRDVQGVPLNFFQVIGPAVLLHGTFDFVLMILGAVELAADMEALLEFVLALTVMLLGAWALYRRCKKVLPREAGLSIDREIATARRRCCCCLSCGLCASWNAANAYAQLDQDYIDGPRGQHQQVLLANPVESSANRASSSSSARPASPATDRSHLVNSPSISVDIRLRAKPSKFEFSVEQAQTVNRTS
eukprot:g14204.t1